MGAKVKTICKNCGKKFEDFKSNHRQFCCANCKNEYQSKICDEHKIKRCKGCGKIFRSRENRTQYCSMDCYYKYIRDNSYTKVSRICKCCGKEFYPNHYKKQFCSKSCWYKWYSEFKQTDEQVQHQIGVVFNLMNEGRTKKAFTKPHVIIDELLDNMNIKHDDEYNIKYYSVDIYLPESDLMIEIMGDYWHTNPVSKFREPKTEVQKQRISKDKAKHTYVKNQYDIEILYLWESDIYNYVDICRELIQLYINNKGVLEDYNSFNYLMIDDKLELGEIIVQPLFLLDNIA